MNSFSPVLFYSRSLDDRPYTGPEYLGSSTTRVSTAPLWTAYVDLKAAFDSVDMDALFKLLEIIGIPQKIIHLFCGLYMDTFSCVRCEGELGEWFPVKTGVRQGCILASDAFNVAMDRVLGRTVAGTRLGTSTGEALCTDFDFADDAALMSEVFDVLLSALTTFEEASELGLHTNWQKTKVQSLSDFLPRPPNLTVRDEVIEVIERFQYLGVLTHKSCSCSLEVQRRMELARSVFGGLEENIWQTRIALRTKLQLYDTYVVPVLLFGSETWALTKSEERRIDAFGWKCLRRICNVRWSDFLTNMEIQRRTGAQPLSMVIQRRRLSWVMLPECLKVLTPVVSWSGCAGRLEASAGPAEIFMAENCVGRSGSHGHLTGRSHFHCQGPCGDR